MGRFTTNETLLSGVGERWHRDFVSFKPELDASLIRMYDLVQIRICEVLSSTDDDHKSICFRSTGKELCNKMSDYVGL